MLTRSRRKLPAVSFFRGAAFVAGVLVACTSFAADFSGWIAPPDSALDPAGGRTGKPALLLHAVQERQAQAWIAPAHKIEGAYVRASGWMRVENLYYLDFGFFAYGSVEFLAGNGTVLKEEPFIISREIMLSDPLLCQSMETHARHLNFDWRYAERTMPVPAGAVQVRTKFGLSSRTTGRAWLDDVALTFADEPEPAERDSVKATALPPAEIRLRSPAVPRLEDPAGHIFFPGEDAVFYAKAPDGNTSGGKLALKVEITDVENFPIWAADFEAASSGEWLRVVVPKEIGAGHLGRYLDIRFRFLAKEEPVAGTQFSFGYFNQFRRAHIADGIEQRYISNLRSIWSRNRHGRFWMQRGDNLTTVSLHVKNIWLDGTQPPDLSNLSSMYLRPDVFSRDFNYGVIGLVNGGEPNPIPEFAHLGHHALPKPESIGAFMRAAVKRFPQVKYWKAFTEMYRSDVPGYRESFVQCQRAFYEAVKAERPDAVVILDNSSVRAEARKLFELGLFNYCDAIDPHLYGDVEDTIFTFFQNEKKLLESWGVHKRWICLEADPVSGGGAVGIDPRWVAEEVPKLMSSYFALGGEKLCLLGSGAVADPTDPFYADAHGGPNLIPTLNYFSYRRFIDLVGLTPAAGSHTLGNMQVRYQQFEDQGRSVVVMWCPAGTATVSVSSASDVRVVDNVRTEVLLRPVDGKVDVTVGYQPVYLVGRPGLKLSLSESPARLSIADGGLVAGKSNELALAVPPGITTCKVIAPSGVNLVASSVPVLDGVARFHVTVPESHLGRLLTLGFIYGRKDAAENIVVSRFELIRPIRAEIWSDAAVRNDEPQYRVRIINDNPVPTHGKIVARAPVTDRERPPEVILPFEAPAKKTTDLLARFPVANTQPRREDETSHEAVVHVYPDQSAPFAIRDRVSLKRWPKVTPGLRVDGDLTDWPSWSGPSVYSMRGALSFVGGGPADPGELRGEIQAAWDRATLYFAVRVRGEQADKSKGVKILLTNAQDKRMGAYEVKNSERSYFIQPAGNSFSLEAISQTPDGSGVIFKAKRVPGGIDYEVAVPVWEAADVLQIDPDRWIRASIVIYAADGKSFWQWYGGGTDPKDHQAYGDFQLAAFGANEWGQLYGSPQAGGGRGRKGYVGLAVLPDGRQARVSVTGVDRSRVEITDASGQLLNQFELPVGEGIHTVDVDRQGRLVVGDRVAGVGFYSISDGRAIPVGPLRSFYPKRHIVEYRSQGYCQDQDGNHFVTLVCKRRAGVSQPCPVQLETALTKISGVTMFGPDGREVASFGKNIVVKGAFAPLRVFGNMGERAGAFLYAESVAIDAAKNLWVADIDASTLQIFRRTEPQVYDELPLVWEKMPADLYPCHLRALPDGSVLAWNQHHMRQAGLVDNRIRYTGERKWDFEAVDLKVADGCALVLDADGRVHRVALP